MHVKKDNNYAKIFPKYIQLKPLNNIKSTHFIVDKILISIRYTKIKEKAFLDSINKEFPKTGNKGEIFTKDKAFKDLFEKRMYIDLGPKSKGMILYQKKGIENIDALISITDASADLLKRIDKHLKGIVGIGHWLSMVEFTFDFIMKENGYRKLLQQLIKRALYFKWGKVGFKYGKNDEYTEYVNSRKSVKQIRMYLKPDVAINNKPKDTFRFEIRVSRQKLKNLKLFSIPDLLKYDLSILNEVNFYRVNPVKLSGSLFDLLCSHYYSRCIYRKIRDNGLQETNAWLKRKKDKTPLIRGCPIKCSHFRGTGCKTSKGFRDVESKESVFNAIKNCRHSEPITKFIGTYCKKINRFDKLKERMIKAFDVWKKV